MRWHGASSSFVFMVAHVLWARTATITPVPWCLGDAGAIAPLSRHPFPCCCDGSCAAIMALMTRYHFHVLREMLIRFRGIKLFLEFVLLLLLMELVLILLLELVLVFILELTFILLIAVRFVLLIELDSSSLLSSTSCTSLLLVFLLPPLTSIHPPL